MTRLTPRATRTDTLFPDTTLVRSMFAAYREEGGIAELRLLPAFGADGHGLFARRGGIPQWRPLLDAFLRKNIDHEQEAIKRGVDIRSEEHTSELQSLMRNSYAVFCLKKKKKRERKDTSQHQT